MLLVVLLIVGVTAAWFLVDIDRRAADLQASQQSISEQTTHIADLIAGIGTAQQSYVVPGQLDQRWFERMSSLVRELYDTASALGPRLRSADAQSSLRAVGDATERLIAADTRARENLRLGQPLMAADVIFSDGRSTLDLMAERLRDLRSAEASMMQAGYAALTRQRWLTLGSVSVLWIAGLLLLLPSSVPHRQSGESIRDVSPAVTESPAQPAITELAQPSTSIDLAATAELCTALSRVSATSELQVLLERAAGILDAPGIILWIGAGDELFAVTAHGYRPEIISALGPITRTADNATAAAWRTGQVTTVAADGAGSGAIVAPMFRPDACIGVLAIEVRHGREHDPASRAVAAVIASQLATAVSAWPAASTVDEPRSAAG
jgi:hypothetical protein